jgi:hypothetical protein
MLHVHSCLAFYHVNQTWIVFKALEIFPAWVIFEICRGKNYDSLQVLRQINAEKLNIDNKLSSMQQQTFISRSSVNLCNEWSKSIDLRNAYFGFHLIIKIKICINWPNLSNLPNYWKEVMYLIYIFHFYIYRSQSLSMYIVYSFQQETCTKFKISMGSKIK